MVDTEKSFQKLLCHFETWSNFKNVNDKKGMTSHISMLYVIISKNVE